MTSFAARTGQTDAFSWSWDLRSLNAKGLDLRLRLPDWVDGLEAAVRARLGKALRRGSLSISLKLTRDTPDGAVAIDPAGLLQALEALGSIARSAADSGVTVAPASSAEILAMKGVLAQGGPAQDTAALRTALLEDLEPLLEDFLEMRSREGAALKAVMDEQLDRIEALREQAADRLSARAEHVAQSLRVALARVVDNTDGIDEARVAQELALLSVKADITEELDRLAAHAQAARALLAESGPVGRKLEFLTQEFNREANTLCSKSQDVALTRIGLDLKAAIDQMREQVQNVE